MTDFWPLDFDLTDIASPLEILQLAQKEWSEQSGGLLTLVIQEALSREGRTMLIVHAKHVPSKRTATLFSVVHRPGAPYPAKIQPRENELPNILKKSYYLEGIGNFAAMGSIAGRQVDNEWVCDTPSEFRSELGEVFNLGTVKSEVLSLVSNSDSSSRKGVEAEGSENAFDAEPNDLG